MNRCAKCGDSPPGGLKNCSRCHGAATGAYCSKDCQVAHWKTHKPMCRPITSNEVWGIKILDNSHGPWDKRFSHILLPRSHPIILRGELCPLTKQCGFPLVICSEAHHGGITSEHDNQPAVYLRIEPHDGFAPMHWQMNDAGTLLYVVRQNGQPLTKEALEIVYKYHAHLLSSMDDESFSQGRGRWQQAPSPELLKGFADEYRRARRLEGRQGFDYFP